MPRRSPRRAGAPLPAGNRCRSGRRGSLRWRGVCFPLFPAGSGASGEIKSGESVPPKSLPFSPLSSFLRLQPARRAQRWHKAKALSSGTAARRVAGPPGGALGAAAARPSPGRNGGGPGAPESPARPVAPLRGPPRVQRDVGCRGGWQPRPSGGFSYFPLLAALPAGEPRSRLGRPPPARQQPWLLGRGLGEGGGLRTLFARIFCQVGKLGVLG